MDYCELRMRIPADQVDPAAAIANMVVPYGLYIEDYSDIEEVVPQIAHIDLIEQELLDRDRSHAIIHVYIAPEENPAEAISYLRARFESAQIPFELEQEQVSEEDWATAWKNYYHPIRVGKRLVIVPSWEHYDTRPDDLPITLDPGMAFGTGSHETTRLCLELVERYAGPGTQTLDIGTGSGILAIAALLLGAPLAVGVDIDEVAVRVAQENAAINKVDDRATFLAGDLAEQVSGTFEMITANIVADVILRLIPSLPQFLKADGLFIASGIIDTREAEVAAALQGAGWVIADRLEAGGWVALSARRA